MRTKRVDYTLVGRAHRGGKRKSTLTAILQSCLENELTDIPYSIYRTTYHMKDNWQFSLPYWPLVHPDVKGRSRFFGLGEVRLAVLSMIEEGPKHGYQLMKELTSRLGSLHRVGSGTVYPVLKQLEHDGLVHYQMNEGRKTYSLTKTGRKLLAGEAEAISGIWKRAAEAEDLGQQIGPHSMAVLGPLSELYTAALRAGEWTGGNPDREDQVRSILRGAAAELTHLIPPTKKH